MRHFLFCLSLLAGFSLQAQYTVPAKGEIFRDDVIPRIDISLPADSLAAILDPANRDSDYHYHARFIFDNGTIRDTLDNIGFRLRGNTSRQSAKKSFKVSFNTYEKGRKYQGLEKFDLNGEHNDPSIARAKICWELYREAGVPASRANHIELYINGQYFGLYIHVEHVDEVFVKNRFHNNDGNLYKCLWPADLKYLGSNPHFYKIMAGDRRVYELKTHVIQDDYSDLAAFIDVLNRAPVADLPCELEPLFDVNTYLKVMALDILTANWDGPIFNKNNFYLYHDQKTDRFVYIPFDLDNTFGIDWFQIDWAKRNIYQWGHDTEARPIYERILQVPIYRERFSYYIHEYAQRFFSPASFTPYLDSLQAQLTPSAAADNYRTLDYGFSLMDFQQSFSQPINANHTPYGLKDYATARRNSIFQQVQLSDMTPILYLYQQRLTNSGIVWELKAVDEKKLQEAKVWYSLDNASPIMADMRDDGTQADRLADDGIWTAEVNWSIPTKEISYYFRAQDSASHSSREPFCGERVLKLASGLVINEFMANNDSIIADEFGEFEDYIELFNAGHDPIYLGDMYITDDFADVNKERLPKISLAAGAYLLLWADSDPSQGDRHLNFKLSKEGEQIGIFTDAFTGGSPIDTLSFGAQKKNISSGRLPNGSGPIVTLAFASPGANNEWMTSIEDASDFVRIYPNPFREGVFFDFERSLHPPTSLQIFDLEGRLLLDQPLNGGSFFWQAAGLAGGMYVARFAREGEKAQFVKLLKP